VIAHKTVQLGELIDIFSGFAFKSKLFNADGNGLPIIRVRDVNTAFSGNYYSGEYQKEFLIENGDLLISMDGDFRIVQWQHGRGLLNQRVCKILVNENVLDQQYLLHFLPLKLQEIHQRTSFATVKHLSVKSIRSVKIPLPSLAEQKRIAKLLDKADELRRKRRDSIAALNALTQSIFLDLFGDPVTNPKKWKSVPLIKIADIVSGVTKGKKFGNKKTVHIPYMRVANVQDGTIRLDDVAEIEVLPPDVERYRLLAGDILLTEGGDPDKLGRGAVWEGSIDPCIHQNHIFRVRISQCVGVPGYISAIIASPLCKRYFFRCAKQTTGIASINMTQLKDCPILLPPKDQQEEFSKRCAAIRTQRIRLLGAQSETENLFLSLQQKAFHHES